MRYGITDRDADTGRQYIVTTGPRGRPIASVVDVQPHALGVLIAQANAHDALAARVAQLEAALKNLVAYYQPTDTSGIWVQAQVALRDAKPAASHP